MSDLTVTHRTQVSAVIKFKDPDGTHQTIRIPRAQFASMSGDHYGICSLELGGITEMTITKRTPKEKA